MRQVYAGTTDWDAQMVRDILISRGIDAIIEDQYHIYYSGADRVYVLNDVDEARAKEIIDEFRVNVTDHAPETRLTWNWRCSRCGEDVEPQFEACWNCGAERPTR